MTQRVIQILFFLFSTNIWANALPLSLAEPYESILIGFPVDTLDLEHQLEPILEKERGHLDGTSITGQEDLQRALSYLDGGKAISPCYLELLSASASLGNSFALNQLGYEYWKGRNAKKEINKAVELFETAISQGNEFARINLALLFAESDTKFQRSVELMKESSANGNAFAKYWLGQEYLIGDKLEQDFSAAETLLKASKDQVVDSEYMLGELYIHKFLSGEVDSLTQALELLENASLRGHPGATIKLELAYGDRSLPIFDKQKARSYLRRLEEQDRSAAAFYESLAEISFAESEIERGNAKDLVVAHANRDVKFIGYFMGELYRRGIGVDVNFDSAFHWYLQAADQGFPPAKFNSAVIILNGYVEDNQGRSAEQLLKEAAALGHKKSIVVLERIEKAENSIK